jgi:hypothetical protein
MRNKFFKFPSSIPHWILIIISSLINSSFVIFLAAPVFAQQIPVNIKSEKLKYIEETGIIEASGSVEVQFKEVTIFADYLYMDSESKTATAEGNVKMVTQSYRATSDRIVYDASREVSTFSGFQTRLAPKKVEGYLYLSAKELNDLGDKMLGESGGVTTCDYELSHFFVLADKVEYYPEDKVVGRNVTLYVGEMPALWMPYMVYDLSRKRKRNWVIGHNEVEGDFIKSAWDYPYGLLYLDLMEKKGFGVGTEVDYNLLGAGTLFLYHLNEKDTGYTNWVTRVNHTKNINPWTKLDLDHSYTAIYLIPSGRRDQTAFGLGLDYKRDARWNLKFNTLDDRMGFLQKYSLQFNQAYKRLSTNYYLNYDFSKTDPKWIRTSQMFSHRRPLWSDNVMFTGKANYYNNVADAGAPGDERLEPMLEIHGQESAYSWAYRSNWYIDLDRDLYTGDESHQYLEKKPEIEVSINPIDLGAFTLRPKFGYGSYHEVRYVSQLGGNRDFSTQRYQASLDASRQIPLALGTLAIVGAGLDQYLYGPGDQLYAYRESLSLQTNLFGFFRNDIDYKKGLTDGNSPFLFDKLGTNYHNVRERISLHHLDKFNWTAEGGHNWQTGKWFDVLTRLSIRPDKRIYWNLRTGWDIENRQYKDLVNNLTFAPYSFLSLNFSTVSNMNTGGLNSGSVVYDMRFLEGEPNQWRLKLSQIYEPASKEFKLRDIILIKDLHCWELKYTYSDYRKEFSLTFSLKALPDEPVGISTGRGFYYEGFEREMREFKQEGEVRRY